MAFTPDVDFISVLASYTDVMGEVPIPPPGDVNARRENASALFGIVNSRRSMPADVITRDFSFPSQDGATIPVRWYSKAGATNTPAVSPAVYYIHGGGMFFGSFALYDAVIGEYVAATGVPFLAVDYRLAPEHPHPFPVEDCYAGLLWLVEHADELEIDVDRVAVMGDSAGGGLAAGVTLMARDRGGPNVAKQILIYPMLDDRSTVPDANLVPFLTWTYDDNATGWHALLGEAAGGAEVPYTAAPARADDLSGLPPMYVDVGELDLFRDESIEYVRRAVAAGVSAELHLHSGVPHAWEAFAPSIAVSIRALADRARAIASL